MLSTQSGVLRQLISIHTDNGSNLIDLELPPPACQERGDLSAAFKGASLQAAACFLRLLYGDDHSGNLAKLAEAELLAAVAGLAHKLEAGRLLDGIAAFLNEVLGSASMPELIATRELAQQCELAQLEERCVDVMASELAAAAQRSHVLVDERELSRLLGPTAARLLLKSHYGSAYPLPILDVRDSRSGKSGGFTFAIDRFSQRSEDKVDSPWVEVGATGWRIEVYLAGDTPDEETHLSVYLRSNVTWCTQAAAAGASRVTARFKFILIDQAPGAAGVDHVETSAEERAFTPRYPSWGHAEFLEPAQLQHIDRHYLEGDRMLLRVELSDITAG